MSRILVLGGYGVFGSRAALRLARDPELPIVVAGRDPAAADAMAQRLRHAGSRRADSAKLDAATLQPEELTRLDVGIVLNTAGPFQGQDYRVARAAIGAGAHYIDLADARDFVTGIGRLDSEARAAGVLVVAGASSVPALAAAVIDALAPRLAAFETLEYAISPGNSFDPGLATTAAILAGLGRPFTSLRAGRMTRVHGWQPLLRRRTGAGTRWLGACDVPDLDLFPARYATLRSQCFLAGVEVKAFHGALWALSWLVRAGLLRAPERLAASLLALKRRLTALGSDRGVMRVVLGGPDAAGRQRHIAWELVAGSGHGPFVPATPAVILVRKLAAGTLRERGAMPCLGLVTLEDFTREVADLDIRQEVT